MKRIFCAALLAISIFFTVAPSANSLVLPRAIGTADQFNATANQMNNYFETHNSVDSRHCDNGTANGDGLSQEDVAGLPLPGERITSLFGLRMHPIFHRRIFHEGVDFSATYKERVHCVLDGVVTKAGGCGGFGNAVYVYHPVARLTTMYAHLCCITVRVGQQVHQQDIVGLAGSTGFSTGVHLHFGVKSETHHWLDPLKFLARVRDLQKIAFAKREQMQPHAVTAKVVPFAVPTVVENAVSIGNAAGTGTVPSNPVVKHAPGALPDNVAEMLAMVNCPDLVRSWIVTLDQAVVEHLVAVGMAETSLRRQFEMGG